MPVMQVLGPTNSFEISRTYPVDADEVRRAVEGAVRRLPRWELGRSSEGGVTAVRRTRLGFKDDVSVSLDEKRTGAHTNTHAAFRSVSRIGVHDLGQNKRNLRELLDAMDRELRSEPNPW
jgi:uncharacterized protein (DUF1499 family)